MDKQLRKLKADYEKKMPVSFTEEDQQKVIENIMAKEASKSNRFHFLVPRLSAGMLIILLCLVVPSLKLFEFTGSSSISKGDETFADRQKVIAEELVIGGRINLEEYPSNYHLYSAHSLSTSIAKQSENRLLREEILVTLKRLNEELNQVKFNKEKKAELQKVQSLTEQALEGDYTDTALLEEIHKSLHDLNRYFNSQRFIDDH